MEPKVRPAAKEILLPARKYSSVIFQHNVFMLNLHSSSLSTQYYLNILKIEPRLLLCSQLTLCE